MSTNGDDTGANRIHQLRKEKTHLRRQGDQAQAVTNQFRSMEEEVDQAIDEEEATRRRKAFSLIKGGGAVALGWLLRRARDHAVATTAALTALTVGPAV